MATTAIQRAMMSFILPPKAECCLPRVNRRPSAFTELLEQSNRRALSKSNAPKLAANPMHESEQSKFVMVRAGCLSHGSETFGNSYVLNRALTFDEGEKSHREICNGKGCACGRLAKWDDF